MTKSIDIHKAVPIPGDGETESVYLNVVLPMPSGLIMEEVDAIFDLDSDKIVEALATTLPGGTFDRVVHKLLGKKLSHLIVPFGGPMKKEEEEEEEGS